MIAKCLPLQSVEAFLSKFNSCRPPPLQKQRKPRKRKKKTTASVPVDPMASVPVPLLAPASLPFCDETIGKTPFCDESIGKTPVQWIDSGLKHAFGDDHVMLKHCTHPDEMYSLGESHSDLDVVVMDCILSRGRHGEMYNEKKGKDATRDAPLAPVQACLLNDVDAVNFAIAVQDGNAFYYCPSAKDDSDEFYRACIVILPQAAGVFYCHRERCPLLTGLLNSYVPMEINWLQLRRDSPNNCFGNGNYVSRLVNAKKCSIWKWSIRRPFGHKFAAIPSCNPGAETQITCESGSPHKATDGRGRAWTPARLHCGRGGQLVKCRCKVRGQNIPRSLLAFNVSQTGRSPLCAGISTHGTEN